MKVSTIFQLEEVIGSLSSSGLVKGVRHLFSWEKEEDWITREDVGKGLDILAKHNITFDLQARFFDIYEFSFIYQIIFK